MHFTHDTGEPPLCENAALRTKNIANNDEWCRVAILYVGYDEKRKPRKYINAQEEISKQLYVTHQYVAFQ